MIYENLDNLAAVYLKLPNHPPITSPWPDIQQQGLTDFQDNPVCWSQVEGDRAWAEEKKPVAVCGRATQPKK